MTTSSASSVALGSAELRRSASLYRAEPGLGPPTPSQTTHLHAARRLDVGPMPSTPGEIRPGLGGMVDGLGFRLLRRLFSGTHRAELESSDYYELENGWLERSEAAHACDDEYYPDPAVPVVEVAPRGETADGGEVSDLTFSSEGYAQGRPTAIQMLRRHPENRLARVRCFRHRGSGRPALIWLHGWGMGFPAVEALVCRARWLYRLGLDVYLYTLPYHARRRPPGVTFAGEVFPTTHMSRANEGFLQAVWECRALMAWHRQQGGAGCGVMGLSLGSYLAAVLASVAPETRCAICLLPVADIPALMWSNGEGTAERDWAVQAGVTFDMFCRSMAVHAPLARDLVIPRERVLLVGARGDRIIPPVHTKVLWEHWGRPRLLWIEGSHLVHFGRAGYMTAVRDHLADAGVL